MSLGREIRESKTLLFPFVLNYNLGRIASYTLAGLIAGILGHVLTIPLGEGFGYRLLQILSALVMVGAGLYIAGWFPRFAYIERPGARFWKFIEPLGRRLIPVSTLRQAFVFGMIWGWLPCGLVYVAIALSATTGDIIRSTFTMLAFGLGTLPAVLGLGIMTHILTRLSKMRRFQKVAGLVLIALAILAAFPDLNPMRLRQL